MEIFALLCLGMFWYWFFKGMMASEVKPAKTRKPAKIKVLKIHKANKEALLNDNLKEPKDFTSKTMRKGQAYVIARNIKANYKTIREQAKPAKRKQTVHEKIAAEELIQKKLQKLFREGMPKNKFQLYKEQSDKRLLNLKHQLKGA